MPPSAGETTRALRDRPLGKALALLVVLVAAVLVARSCGSTDVEVTQEQAIEIAREQVSFEANDVRIRIQKRGLSEYAWLVGLGVEDANGVLTRATNVVVDSETGAVIEVREAIP